MVKWKTGMRLIVKVCKVFLLGCSLLLISCATKDFIIVDVLRKGMSMDEAKSTIESYSFERKYITTRPKSGWVENDETFTNIPGRALWVEKN